SEVGDPKIDAKEAITVIETPQPRREVSELEFGSNWYIEHTVSKDQTLESISELYAITRETLLSVNAIKNISSVKEGSVLKIPKQNGQLYTVVVGDSLSTISNRFNPNLGWKNLQQINALSSEVIYPGQKIFIPSAQVEDDGSFASFDRFVKPAEGRITGLYGQTVVYGQSENVVTLKGIWIEGASQSPIFASGSGNVEEIGNDVKGSGNYVVLKHDYGYKTTYAHLDRIDVKIGDEIKKGQQIGIMGQSGNIGKRALYFSIEQEGVALNPANFF
ncbi:MAG: M23 family metallopeptidase, partial [Sphaerochaetaceae bacterium]